MLAGLTFTLLGEAIARGAGVRSPISSRLPKWKPINRKTAQADSAPTDEDAVLTVRNMSVAVPAGETGVAPSTTSVLQFTAAKPWASSVNPDPESH